MLFILICGSSWRTSSVSSQRVTYAEYCPCIVPSTSICPMPSAFGAGAYGTSSAASAIHAAEDTSAYVSLCFTAFPPHQKRKTANAKVYFRAGG